LTFNIRNNGNQRLQQTHRLPIISNRQSKDTIRRIISYLLKSSKILYKKNNKNTEKPYRVISEDEVEDMHDNMRHSGINSTFERISALFYWPQMYEDICRHNTFCQPCQKRKPQTHRHELCLIQVK
jgi:hypothetical protein